MHGCKQKMQQDGFLPLGGLDAGLGCSGDREVVKVEGLWTRLSWASVFRS